MAGAVATHFSPAETVRLRVPAELEAEVVEHLPLLGAELVGTARLPDNPFRVVLHLCVPDAPDGAAEMTPWFRADDGKVSVDHIEWLREDGSRIDPEEVT